MTSISIDYLPYESSSENYFNKLRSMQGRVWLDSGLQRCANGRYDILCAQPIEYLYCPSNEELQSAIANLGIDTHLPSEIEALPFVGGAIGCVDYEATHQAFNLNPGSAPSNTWAIYSWALVQDHEKKQCCLITTPHCGSEIKQSLLTTFNSASAERFPDYSCSSFASDMPREHYTSAFNKIQEYIKSGDCYQINFTQRFSAQFSGDAASAYLKLRRALSGPFSAFIDFPKRKILSLSPEQFIHIQNRRAQTKPIKGTVRRGDTSYEDENLKIELVDSDKNRAENLMIVDLLRNDFGKNCVPGTVQTPHLFTLESYKNVHHLVSTVVGDLREDITNLDFFYSCFPGGSITGAPKRRAMEIIHELETTERQTYCGSIAYLSAHNKMNSNITIRTIQIENGQAYCWGGGGIVADSNETDEYEESVQKVKVLLDTLKTS
jgi:para-aminobenzoate synthetase component 1